MEAGPRRVLRPDASAFGYRVEEPHMVRMRTSTLGKIQARVKPRCNPGEDPPLLARLPAGGSSASGLDSAYGLLASELVQRDPHDTEQDEKEKDGLGDGGCPEERGLGIPTEVSPSPGRLAAQEDVGHQAGP